MTLREALDIVVELAEDNALDINDPYIKGELAKQAQLQDQALGIVGKFLSLLGDG